MEYEKSLEEYQALLLEEYKKIILLLDEYVNFIYMMNNEDIIKCANNYGNTSEMKNKIEYQIFQMDNIYMNMINNINQMTAPNLTASILASIRDNLSNSINRLYQELKQQIDSKIKILPFYICRSFDEYKIDSVDDANTILSSLMAIDKYNQKKNQSITPTITTPTITTPTIPTTIGTNSQAILQIPQTRITAESTQIRTTPIITQVGTRQLEGFNNIAVSNDNTWVTCSSCLFILIIIMAVIYYRKTLF